jgi:phage shock protein PspC (stress-responsive transcriptional regulator)
MAGPEPTGRRRLSRSRHERLIFGVCGGLASYFDIDPALVRIGFVVAAILPPLSPISIIGYLVLAAILPDENTIDLPGRDQVRHNFESLRTDVGNLTESVRSNLGMGSRSPRETVDVDLPPEVPETTSRATRTDYSNSSPSSTAGESSPSSPSSTAGASGEGRSESAEPPRTTGAVR